MAFMKNTDLPVWDLTVFYDGFDSAGYKDDFEKLKTNIKKLGTLAADFSEKENKDLENFLVEILELYNKTGALTEETVLIYLLQILDGYIRCCGPEGAWKTRRAVGQTVDIPCGIQKYSRRLQRRARSRNGFQ